MEPFVEKLKRVLREVGYTDDELELEVTPSGKVGGHIVSEAFKGETQINRQDQLWAALSKRLTEDELARIVALMTVTPTEVGDDDDD